MSRGDTPADPAQAESLFARISRRKHEARGVEAPGGHGEVEGAPEAGAATPDPASVGGALPTDADMPSVDSLTPDSDYSGFLSPQVSEGLRRLALRRLWRSPEFGVRDGLEIYDGDYTSFEALGGVVTAEMRHRLAVEARRQAQELASREPAAGEASEDPQARTRLAQRADGPVPGAPEEAPDESEGEP